MRGKTPERRINKTHNKKKSVACVVICVEAYSVQRWRFQGLKKKVSLKCVHRDTRWLRQWGTSRHAWALEFKSEDSGGGRRE